METAMEIPIDRSKPFDPVNFLGTPGFTIKSQSALVGSITTLDTSKLRLESGMYYERHRPLYRRQRVEWLEAKGLLLPDGHIIEALKKHSDLLPESWSQPGLTIHLDGLELSSSWDGRDFEIYTIFNGVQKMREFPYLGPWAGINPSLVIDP